jgi:hypothetical protein
MKLGVLGIGNKNVKGLFRDLYGNLDLEVDVEGSDLRNLKSGGGGGGAGTTLVDTSEMLGGENTGDSE